MIRDLDYSRLRRSLAYLVEQYAGEIAPNEPAKPLEQENRRESDQSVLVRAIAEFVEGSQDFCAERVSEIDRDLERRDAYTLSLLREQYSEVHGRSKNDVKCRRRKSQGRRVNCKIKGAFG